MRFQLLSLLACFPGSFALRLAAHAAAPALVRSGTVLARSAGAPDAGGGMVDGARIGPPPDMPSLLLNNRIVYLGMPIGSAVT